MTVGKNANASWETGFYPVCRANIFSALGLSLLQRTQAAVTRKLKGQAAHSSAGKEEDSKMHNRRTKWMLMPLTILACVVFGMVPTSASAQSHSGYCTKIRHERLNAFEQKQWGLVVSKGREFMSTCQDGGAEAEANVLFDIGFGLKKQGKFEEAVPILRRCTTVKPDDTHCLTYLAEALDKQGEFEEVVPILKRCVTIKPDEAGCWVDLGIALDQAGRASDARKAYEQAISIGGYTEANAAAIELARECLSHPQTALLFGGTG